MRLRWLTLAALAGACGVQTPMRPTSDLASPLCAQPFRPCGGDLTGTWSTIAARCPAPPSSGACRQLTADSSRLTGMIMFGADQTFLATATLNGSSTEIIQPKGACLPPNAKSCSDLAPASTPQMMVSCSGDLATSCTCIYTYQDYMKPLGGSYQTSGTDLTVSYRGGMIGPAGYCVQSGAAVLPAGVSGFDLSGELVFSR